MEHVLFFSASAEKSVIQARCILRTRHWPMASPVAIVFVVAAFAAVRTVHAVARPHSLLFWLMMLS